MTEFHEALITQRGSENQPKGDPEDAGFKPGALLAATWAVWRTRTHSCYLERLSLHG